MLLVICFSFKKSFFSITFKKYDSVVRLFNFSNQSGLHSREVLHFEITRAAVSCSSTELLIIKTSFLYIVHIQRVLTVGMKWKCFLIHPCIFLFFFFKCFDFVMFNQICITLSVKWHAFSLVNYGRLLK